MKTLTQRQLAEFGQYVLDTLNGSEWDSDTLQDISDRAYFKYGITFDEPWEG